MTLMQVQVVPGRVSVSLPALYAVFATIFTLQLAISVPTVQYPDEGAHLVRADQISQFGLIARRLSPDGAGGQIDQGLVAAIARFYPLVVAPDAHVTRSMLEPINWGPRVELSFPNTAIYPPFFYLPASASLVIGKWLHFDVLRTATLMRVSTAFVSVAVSTAAIYIAGGGGLWLFAILLLPSSAMLMSAVSQDGPMLASTALVTALTIRLCDARSVRWRLDLVLLTLLLSLLAMSRPPYIAFAFLLIVIETPSRIARWMALFACVAVAATWWGICAAKVMVSTDPTHLANSSKQFWFIAKHLSKVPLIVVQTFSTSFAHEYAEYFITPLQMPKTYYLAAWFVLSITAVLSLLAARMNKRAFATLASVLSACIGVFAIQYITWTPVGAPVVHGVLGRYFLPPAILLGTCVATRQHVKPLIYKWIEQTVLLFPIISITVTAHRVITRFYL